MKTLVAALVLSLATCALSLAAFGAEKGKDTNAPKVIKKADLPDGLKGGKGPKSSDGIPQCTVGRVILAGNDHDREPLLTWAGDHQKHPCFGADKVYVCHAGRNLSVRCE